MNRIIKFRVWNSVQKKMLYNPACSGFLNDWLEDGPSIHLQWTGLTDKNGKEIYEGDILQKWGEVKYVEHAFWCIADNPIGEEGHFWPNENNREIIGNIYENPELLEKNLPVKE